MKILAIGDIVGRTGRNVLQSRIQGLIDQYRIELVIANGENAAGGRSITQSIARDFYSCGVNVITSGNHIWDNKDIYGFINDEVALLRPANYPQGVPGKGYFLSTFKGVSVCVINLLGRVHMEPVDCPFRTFDAIYEIIKDRSDIIVVDFHGEATSEKRAFGWYVDGRASVVFGTHTHVQTADEEILPGGTGFITDIGMTGSFDSVIGMEKRQSIEKFLTQIRPRYEVATGNPGINAVIFDVDKNGKTHAIMRIRN
ncbi:MAG TPA: TIGR00282 family metallophosphoesterase [Spirochaetota bacterium]|nr:TIGR00282 family metallophosphoesterase [Spirochaetota bacterium]HPI89276.1 TIGR00282 family metallophosphoesterase [Spirochaetota bacterium]HPR48564.1 TIGR00282 family metallophosphoesterase [Spirochaetota bacterium]